MIDIKSLQEKAEKAVGSAAYAMGIGTNGWVTHQSNVLTFHNAASPETILSLCSELSAAKIEKEAAIARAENKWIDVKQELPPNRAIVLVCTTGGYREVCVYREGFNAPCFEMHNGFLVRDVALWMNIPLPAAPPSPAEKCYLCNQPKDNGWRHATRAEPSCAAPPSPLPDSTEMEK